MKKIGVGLASFGMSGQVFHAPLLSADPGFEIISILERTRSLSRERYPDAKIVRNYGELLKDGSIELVVVNTPDRFHYEMAREALEEGKDVILEKPFVLDSRQGDELITLAADRGCLLSVFQNRRWDGDFLTIREILDKGLLGRLVEYEAHFDRYRNFIQENTWKEDPSSGTGTLYNLGAHLIDQALVLFGKPEHVHADIRIQRTGGKVDDAFTLWLGYPEVKVTLKASYLVKEPGPRFMLHGTEGSFLKHGIDPQEEALKKGDLPGSPGWGAEPEEEWGRLNTEIGPYDGPYKTLPGNYGAYYENIYQVLTGQADPAVTAAQANMVVRVIEAAFKSNRSGDRVRI
ncbi:MAG: oxidoreductase [Bacteroides sp. SM23_62]|nr:MAG: oxidoreductase [Bacteroides sp. SM23_62]